MQSAAETPTVRHMNPDADLGIDYRQGWREAPGAARYSNPYRIGWEDFLCHVVAGTPIRADLRAGIRDVQFVEACYRSAAQKTWMDIDNVV
jgi:predicted dehydrogenase